MEEIPTDLVGSVWKILVQPGEAVSAEQEIMILESMKMEIPVVAEAAGIVASVEVAEGQAVNSGDVLARIELQ